MIHIHDITSDLSDKCRSIMYKLESGNIYIGKYRENIFQCENIVDSNHCKINKFSCRKVEEVFNNIHIINNLLRNSMGQNILYSLMICSILVIIVVCIYIYIVVYIIHR